MAVPAVLAGAPGVVPEGRARVLAAVLAVYASCGRATIRDVAAAAGYDSPSTVHKHLVRLRENGAVTWDDGRQGTLRPTVWPASV